VLQAEAVVAKPASAVLQTATETPAVTAALGTTVTSLATPRDERKDR
jgi:hypothetical protein